MTQKLVKLKKKQKKRAQAKLAAKADINDFVKEIKKNMYWFKMNKISYQKKLS